METLDIVSKEKLKDKNFICKGCCVFGGTDKNQFWQFKGYGTCLIWNPEEQRILWTDTDRLK